MWWGSKEGGDSKASRGPLGWRAPATAGVRPRGHTQRLLRSAENKRLHPAIIPPLDRGFIFPTVDTVAREDRRSAKFHPSGRLTQAYRFSPHSWPLRLCVS